MITSLLVVSAKVILGLWIVNNETASCEDIEVIAVPWSMSSVEQRSGGLPVLGGLLPLRNVRERLAPNMRFE